MMDTSDNRFLYMVKGIACIMVILIHVKFPGNLGTISETLARFAVPMFFAVSGRFLLHDHEDVDKDPIRRSVHIRLIHTIRITFVAWVYIHYILLYICYPAEQDFPAGFMKNIICLNFQDCFCLIQVSLYTIILILLIICGICLRCSMFIF